MADYEFLTPATVPAYVASKPHLAELVDVDTLEVEEVGDGNLNLVFVCKDGDGRGICLKQSLPYVRLVGEGWPMTAERIFAEARGHKAAVDVTPDLVPEFYGIDHDRYILAMENLMGWTIWRGVLNEGQMHTTVGEKLGVYVANLAFSTSLFAVDQQEVKQRMADAINPELCQITEDLVFTEPYIEADNNSFADGVAPTVYKLREDSLLRARANEMKYLFMTGAEALVHGDLHTGSVMVKHNDDGSGDCRVIDPEFCYYGPIGFDLGALFGNYLAARARAAVLDRPAAFQEWLAGLAAETWDAFEAEFRRLWPSRIDTTWTDEFLDRWLAKIAVDAIGFGGMKATRRIIGLAKVSDIETLEPDLHVPAAVMVLETAARWIKDRDTLATPAAAAAMFDQVRAEVLS
jgi:5-methylthioribose kinase